MKRRPLEATALFAVLLATSPVAAQRQAQTPAPPSPQRMDAVTWYAVGTPTEQAAPQAPRAAKPTALDLRMGEEESGIIVYGHRRGPDLRVHGEERGAPEYTDAAVPFGLRMTGANACSGAAYRTIGGQAATGADMIGAYGVGAGRC